MRDRAEAKKRAEALAAKLFAAIEHGDEEHRAWLKKKLAENVDLFADEIEAHARGEKAS